MSICSYYFSRLKLIFLSFRKHMIKSKLILERLWINEAFFYRFRKHVISNKLY